MAGDEHQPKQIVADIVVDRCIEVRNSALLLGFELVSQLFVLPVEQLLERSSIDTTILREECLSRYFEGVSQSPLSEFCSEHAAPRSNSLRYWQNTNCREADGHDRIVLECRA